MNTTIRHMTVIMRGKIDDLEVDDSFFDTSESIDLEGDNAIHALDQKGRVVEITLDYAEALTAAPFKPEGVTMVWQKDEHGVEFVDLCRIATHFTGPGKPSEIVLKATVPGTPWEEQFDALQHAGYGVLDTVAEAVYTHQMTDDQKALVVELHRDRNDGGSLLSRTQSVTLVHGLSDLAAKHLKLCEIDLKDGLSDAQSHARDAIEQRVSDLVADVPGLRGAKFNYDPRGTTTGIVFADGSYNSLNGSWKVPVNTRGYRALAKEDFWTVYSEEARYHQMVQAQLDWRPNFEAWHADGAVFDEDMFQEIEADGGYRAICADPKLQLKWQDVLDHVLQTRLYAVRNALIGDLPSPAGPGFPFQVDDKACTLVMKFDHVGAGRNVAALHYVVRQGGSELVRIDDRMAMDSADMTVFIRRQAEDALRQQHGHDVPVRDQGASETSPDTHVEPVTTGKARSSTPAGFTPSEEQIRCGQALMVAQAHEMMVRPIVEGYQRAILAKHQFKVAARWAETRIADADNVISEGRDSYLLSDEDFAVYHEACHLARDAHGLAVSKPENCPLLEAENMRIQSENALLRTWEGHPNFSALADASVLRIEQRTQVIDLTLGLLAPHMKANANDMLADLGIHPPAPKAQDQDNSLEP